MPLRNGISAFRREFTTSWRRLPVPRVVAEGTGPDEAIVNASFLGKTFDEVDLSDGSELECPLVLLTPEASVYYSATYLLLLMELIELANADNPQSSNFPLTHFFCTLADDGRFNRMRIFADQHFPEWSKFLRIAIKFTIEVQAELRFVVDSETLTAIGKQLE